MFPSIRRCCLYRFLQRKCFLVYGTMRIRSQRPHASAYTWCDHSHEEATVSLLLGGCASMLFIFNGTYWWYKYACYLRALSVTWPDYLSFVGFRGLEASMVNFFCWQSYPPRPQNELLRWRMKYDSNRTLPFQAGLHATVQMRRLKSWHKTYLAEIVLDGIITPLSINKSWITTLPVLLSRNNIRHSE